MIVLLDAGPLGQLTSPRGSLENEQCRAWASGLVAMGVRVLIPEIADYEVRRELIRADRRRGLMLLDATHVAFGLLPISSPVMRRAAETWAEARRRGRPTADPSALDADVILAAQALVVAEVTGDSVIVATTNARHLNQFVAARRWQEIGV